MKKICLLLLFATTSLIAQNRYRDQNISAGMGGITGKNGFFVSAGYQRIIGFQGWSFKGDIIYASQYAKIKNEIPLESKLPIEHYMVLPSALLTFDNWGLDPFYLSLYGGGMLGYEILNKNKKVLENSKLESTNLKNSFIYGASLGAMVEYELSRQFVLNIEGRQLYRMGSQAGQFTFYIGGGLRYYIN